MPKDNRPDSYVRKPVGRRVEQGVKVSLVVVRIVRWIRDGVIRLILPERVIRLTPTGIKAKPDSEWSAWRYQEEGFGCQVFGPVVLETASES